MEGKKNEKKRQHRVTKGLEEVFQEQQGFVDVRTTYGVGRGCAAVGPLRPGQWQLQMKTDPEILRARLKSGSSQAQVGLQPGSIWALVRLQPAPAWLPSGSSRLQLGFRQTQARFQPDSSLVPAWFQRGSSEVPARLQLQYGDPGELQPGSRKAHEDPVRLRSGSSPSLRLQEAGYSQGPDRFVGIQSSPIGQYVHLVLEAGHLALRIGGPAALVAHVLRVEALALVAQEGHLRLEVDRRQAVRDARRILRNRKEEKRVRHEQQAGRNNNNAASALAAPTQDGIIVVQRRGPAPKSGPAPDPDPVPSVPVEKKPRGPAPKSGPAPDPVPSVPVEKRPRGPAPKSGPAPDPVPSVPVEKKPRGPAPKSGPAPDPDPVPSVPVEKKPRGPAPKSGPAPDPDPVPSVPVEKKPRVVYYFWSAISAEQQAGTMRTKKKKNNAKWTVSTSSGLDERFVSEYYITAPEVFGEFLERLIQTRFTKMLHATESLLNTILEKELGTVGKLGQSTVVEFEGALSQEELSTWQKEKSEGLHRVD
ncbi:hypothetical protein FOCC_FOCC001053 [Frankliniella occidentalis]|nr:hypothetical protein FOCC_FOCC001053 [Frankliniella occidentalis]